MGATAFDALVAELGDLLAPLVEAVEDPYWLDLLLQTLGSAPNDPVRAVLATKLQSILDVVQEIQDMAANPAPSFADIGHLLESAKKAFLAMQSLDAPGAFVAELSGIGKDLVDLLLGMYVRSKAPLLYRIAVVLTVIDALEDIAPTPGVTVNGNVVRAPVRLPRFHAARLVALIRDPVALLKSQYLTPLTTDADANAMADKIFPRVLGLLRELSVPCRYGVTAEEIPLLGDSVPYLDHTLTVHAAEELEGATEDVGFTFALSSAERGDLGLVISPFGTLQFTRTVGNWTFELDFTEDVEALAIGRNGTKFLASAATTTIDGRLSATLAAPANGPAFAFGTPTSTRIEIGGALIEMETTLSGTVQQLALSAEISSSQIVIMPGDGDSFLASLLPAGGLQAKFDFGLGWSTTQGVTFKGAAGLDATLPVALSLGGVVTIPTIHLGLQANDTGLALEVSASIGASVGPVVVLLDRVGVLASATFPDGGGNLGAADLTFGLKPPSGAGLSIDAAGVSGGGLLTFDTSKHEYSGVLQLAFTEFALQAFGIITTQVAGGSGYSLLALIDADFPPIPLGWGFTLNGVGGLFAVHRTANIDALRAALQAGQLATILFPKNAITNAPQILAQLDALFPTAPGRFLFGPMALIGWGTPTVLTVALAVILELPEPVRIILLARIALRLPSESVPLVRINMDALGVLDLSQDLLSLDATLYDSKIMGYALTGDMALRANWSGQREFLLAIGGFHPQFTPPTGFPTLKRITIDMPSGPISRLRLAAYLAVTSNTVQFGAALDVFLGVAGFGLAGHLAFDALLQISPFHFDANISGSVALMAGSDNLTSVELDASLSGPGPWSISGSFKVHIIFFDVHKSFSYSWGDGTPAQQIPAVNVLALLSTAFADARNWGAALPDAVPKLVSLRSQDGSTVVGHPLAQLEAHQSVAPLDLQIERFGAAPITGASTFSITDFRLNGVSLMARTTPVLDDFAPAQFFNLSDTEKLAGPSFEQHDAGLRLASEAPSIAPGAQSKTIAYETFYIDEAGAAPRADAGAFESSFSTGELTKVIYLGASARAEIRSAGKLRFQAPGKPISVAAQKFTVANIGALASAGLTPGAGVTYTEAKALRAKALPAQRAQLQILATHEMAAS